MRNIGRYIFVLLSISLGSVCAFAQAEFKPAYGLNDAPTVQTPKPDYDPKRMENWDGTVKSVVKVEQNIGPRFKTSIFNKHRSKFQALCKAMRADGRSDTFGAMMEANAYKDDKCVGCRPLLGALASSCRPEKPRLTKEQKEAGTVPTPIPKQREPNAAVIDSLAQLFSAILENNREAPEMPEIMKALERMKTVLLSTEGRTPGEREYYGAISFHAFHPFEKYIAEQEKLKSKGPSIEGENGSGAKLDELFNF